MTTGREFLGGVVTRGNPASQRYPTDSLDSLVWQFQTDASPQANEGTGGVYPMTFTGAAGMTQASSGLYTTSTIRMYPDAAGQYREYLANHGAVVGGAGKNITVSAWIWPEGIVDAAANIVGKLYNPGAWGAPFTGLEFHLYSSGGLLGIHSLVRLVGGGNVTVDQNANEGGQVGTHTWNFVSMHFTASTSLFVCINGSLIKTVACAADADVGTGEWQMGGYIAASGLPHRFFGKISDLRIAQTVRSVDWHRAVFKLGRGC